MRARLRMSQPHLLYAKPTSSGTLATATWNRALACSVPNNNAMSNVMLIVKLFEGGHPMVLCVQVIHR
jgi:hypothetical protein